MSNCGIHVALFPGLPTVQFLIASASEASIHVYEMQDINMLL